MNKKSIRSSCPINLALEQFGDKWSLLIIRDMLFQQLTGYGDFMAAPEGISTNILANRLRQLEDHGLIEKLPDPRDRKKFIYLLTEKGEDLIPVLAEMVRWALKYNSSAELPAPMCKQLETDFENFVAQSREQAKTNRLAVKALLRVSNQR